MPGPNSYAHVLLPLAVEGRFTYLIPETLQGQVLPGQRVVVPFGKKRQYTGIVRSLEDTAPEGRELKPILQVLDEVPLLEESHLQLWDWMASYYMCTGGEVMRAALPSGMRPESESRVRVNRGYEDRGDLDARERLLFEVIRDQEEVSVGDLDVSGIPGDPLKLLKQLVDRGAVELNEFMTRGPRLKRREYLCVAETHTSESARKALEEDLRRAPRQLEILRILLENQEPMPGGKIGLARPLLMEAGISASALTALLKRGILVQEIREEQDAGDGEVLRKAHELSKHQKTALADIRALFEEKHAVLLHGVTSSGKTEIYIHLIQDMLRSGKQVLYLLPEIALTTQIIGRIRRVFGNRVGVYHSKSSDADRVHVYRNLLGHTDDPPYEVIIGVRSAVFLPLRRLGLILIDEEHEHTFKQHDPAPRYHARDTAQVLALYQKARVLLGTATPSFESLYNARSGKFGYVTLSQRHGEVEMPRMVISDIRQATKRKQMTSFFGPDLVQGIRDALDRKEQIILFQNRRGYANYLMCLECSHIPKCHRCDVSLTYHRISGKMECHYCGHKEPVPHACPSCGSTRMHMKGMGTERIEDEIGLLFEGIRVGRLDTDAVRSVRAYEKLLQSFARRELDVMIGTQMLTKGLDFAHVSLVGVLDADSLLYFPDFRAFERSFQLISQVSGRAGRRDTRGTVVVQTMDPGHPVIRCIARGDFETLYADQMEERQAFSYPPFSRMIRVSFRHRIPSILDSACDMVARELRDRFGHRVFGPQYPPVRKVYLDFIKHIHVKIERDASYERAKVLLKEVLEPLKKSEVYRAVRVSVDVDPY
ncbi:MAG: primosomal protein N' [Bacteroidales bacterium]